MSATESSETRGVLCKIQFVILGGTPAGLTSAIALRKAGHEVTVLETEDEATLSWRTTGVQMPPSMSKLLYRWGLRDELKEFSVKCRDLILTRYEEPDVLGVHRWHEEILRDAGGDYSYLHMSDLRELLYRTAVSHGAKMQKGRVAAYEFDKEGRPILQLVSGTVLPADVVIGTDPSDEITRNLVYDDEEAEEDRYQGLTLFNLEAQQSTLKDRSLLDDDPIHAWLGPARGALGFLAGRRDKYTLLFYTRDPAAEQYWDKKVEPKAVLPFLGHCDSRLRNVVESATSIRCEALREPADPPTTVDPSGRVLLIGDAAYKFPKVTVNAVSTSICDAFALGEFFKHLHGSKQIGSFLLAFENIQRSRVRTMVQADLAIVETLAMPPGVEQDMRNIAMKERHIAGGGLLEGEAEGAETWAEETQTFAYDAEEHAAEWWNDWGLLQERATDDVHIRPERVPTLSVDKEYRASTPDVTTLDAAAPEIQAI